ncbi:MAG: hypothetical protein EXR68_02300 [Dehalococcoidia bacterium]|nr:hypothetical protein [Dehalococcoidia bacterium]
MPDRPPRNTSAGGFDDHGELDLDSPSGPLPPADEVIEAIADSAHAIPYDDLPALSDANEDVATLLLGLWPRIAAARRRELLASVQRLAEEDITLDFRTVHLTALRDPDPATRILAVRGLWEEEREDIMRLLTTMVRTDTESAVRGEAATTLGQFVVSMEFGLLSEDAAEHLAETLRDVIEDPTEDDEVRARALEAIGASSEEWVAELIADTYETGVPRMRLATIRAMGRNASDDWLPVLIHNFDDDDAETRVAAATSAGQLLLGTAVESLTALVEDTDDEVQIAAVHALGEIGGDAAETVLLQLLNREAYIADAARHALAEARLMSLEPHGLEDDEDTPDD